MELFARSPGFRITTNFALLISTKAVSPTACCFGLCNNSSLNKSNSTLSPSSSILEAKSSTFNLQGSATKAIPPGFSALCIVVATGDTVPLKKRTSEPMTTSNSSLGTVSSLSQLRLRKRILSETPFFSALICASFVASNTKSVIKTLAPDLAAAMLQSPCPPPISSTLKPLISTIDSNPPKRTEEPHTYSQRSHCFFRCEKVDFFGSAMCTR
mmetsp:Transcript_17573/g.21628  ORF Transcript_17573/g.21628 Transcript_17573/m.21628 type:complete len:213 (-) Transcript_17573:171-809(-)